MKKYLCILACMAIGVLLFASSESVEKTQVDGWLPSQCSVVNNFDGVSMTVTSVTPPQMNVTMENESDHECTYGADFWLEKKMNGKWYQVPYAVKGNIGFNLVGYELPSGSIREWTMDWHWLYGNLMEGEYRIVKTVLDFRGTGDFDKYYLTADFIVR